MLVSSISIPSYFYFGQIAANDTDYGTLGDDKRPILAYIPSGTYIFDSPIYYSCAYGYIVINYNQFTFVDNGITLTIQPAMSGGCFMSGDSAEDGHIDVSCYSPGTCTEVYTLLGAFTSDDTWEAVFTVSFSGSCMDCLDQSWNITGTRVDEVDPIITDAPSNFTVEYGYTGVDISWTATDANPNTYTIKLDGSIVVVGPTAWINATEILYNVPDGFAVGDYLYTVNFTDDSDNFITDTVKMTVIEDNASPIIINFPSNFTIEFGYTAVTILWIATDTNPNIYTIELQGSGIVAGPNSWSNGTEIIYYIPDGLTIGEYLYTVNFSDDYGNYATDTVKLTVQEVITRREGPTVSFGNYYLVFVILGIISLVIAQKRRKLLFQA